MKKDPHHHVYYLEKDEEFSITPTFHYKFQGKSDQLDLGAYVTYNFIMGGIWYRGIPVKYYNKDFKNNESMIVMVGYRFEKKLSVTYSYDFTLSGLTKVGTGGSHELNITYHYQKHKNYKPMKRLPCPTFHHK